MPVLVRPSDHDAVAWGSRGGHSRFTRATSPSELLALTTSNETRGKSSVAAAAQTFSPLIQSSFALGRESTVFAAKNGLVFACLEAYSEHHNLALRPDDVWLAILGQLGAYVNGHAEELRHLLVEHDGGRRQLHIEADLDGLDHGRVAFLMTKLVGGAVRDPALRDWVLPAFSTTERDDQTAASIAFLGTMQKYFAYSWGTRCGIPSVALLGDADDWVEIRRRCAERLGSGAFGPGAARWFHQALAPVLDGFLESFRDPHGAAALDFWARVVDSHQPNGSGAVTYSGWVTAFCYWDEGGRCLHGGMSASSSAAVTHSARPRLSRSQVPMGFSKVPVTLFRGGESMRAEMVAGSVAIGVEGEKGRRLDTIQPMTGWFMYYV